MNLAHLLRCGLTTLVLVSTRVDATVLYSYTGNVFTDVSAPYSTSDFVTAQLQLDQPLVASPGAVINAATLSGFALSINDGVQTFTDEVGRQW